MLRLGVEGKAVAWRTLRALADTDSRLNRDQFNELMATARQQADLLEELRVRQRPISSRLNQVPPDHPEALQHEAPLPWGTDSAAGTCVGHAADNPLTCRADPQQHHHQLIHQAESLLPGSTSAQHKNDKNDNHNDHYRANADVHGLCSYLASANRAGLISEPDPLAARTICPPDMWS